MLIRFARDTAGVDQITLDVRSDNDRAIRLYRKFGFEKTGVFPGYVKINDELFDCDLMVLRFR
ncbi:MAG: GNAT family N-acetyltransferase [Solobacterium sp.]|nr:GNAT family N-acetyltransferase [Solobacterium sp.]